MKLPVALVLGVLLPCQFSFSAEGSYASGVGVESCGDYLSKREKFDQGKLQGMYAFGTAEWIRGFNAGQNRIKGELGRSQSTESLPTSTVVAYIDKFCRDHPLSNVFAGTECLFKELSGEKQLPYCR